MAERKPWQDEIEWAETICAPLGCVVARSDHQYEIATVKGDGVSLIIYPHKTSAWNHHARVRDNGSKDKTRALDVMRHLDLGIGLPCKLQDRVRYSCIFTVKNMPSNHWERPTQEDTHD